MKKVLHVGCGNKRVVGSYPLFPAADWAETAVDIDPGLGQDVVASMTDMGVVPDRSHDAVYSSHSLEHLFPHELRQALAEFHRVLKPGGFVIALVPDIQKAAAAIAAGKVDEPLYMSERGPIFPLEVLYGHHRSLAKGWHHMAHRNGFVAASLGDELARAGFVEIQVKRKLVDLLAMAYKDHRPAGSPRLAREPATAES